jgi:hypothetical protein
VRERETETETKKDREKKAYAFCVMPESFLKESHTPLLSRGSVPEK